MSLESMSKKQLIEALEDLQSRIKARDEKSINDGLGNLNAYAVGLEKDENGDLAVTTISYSKETGLGKVTSKEIYKRAPHMAVYNAKKVLGQDILLKLQRGE